ncbi:MAG: membrane protein insertion efficiency factor YidD [Planctomycetota bacterium]|nr:MAG: membrane protein insertion efficiency factor YidD [Planctomycetota bacterium]RLS95158.1 MAG: membrane protein insertion efficiency factor YidD [Planctomycetota bacterium]
MDETNASKDQCQRRGCACSDAVSNAEHDDARRTGLAARALIASVRGYQIVLGPLLGGQCRFTPSCSFYGIEALRVHGAWRGSALTLRRLIRCHPWGGQGDDPVPSR